LGSWARILATNYELEKEPSKKSPPGILLSGLTGMGLQSKLLTLAPPMVISANCLEEYDDFTEVFYGRDSFASVVRRGRGGFQVLGRLVSSGFANLHMQR
jgi:hypothetical protein